MSKPTEQQPLSKLDEQRQNGYTAWDKGLNAVRKLRRTCDRHATRGSLPLFFCSRSLLAAGMAHRIHFKQSVYVVSCSKISLKRTPPSPPQVEVPPPALIGTFAASEAPAAAAASAAGGPSAWNAAGVFEERDLFGWAKSELQTRALSLTSTVGGVTVRVTSVSDVSGTATIIFSRGKKRAGFDLEFKLEYEGTPGGKSVKGSMR